MGPGECWMGGGHRRREKVRPDHLLSRLLALVMLVLRRCYIHMENQLNARKQSRRELIWQS